MQSGGGIKSQPMSRLSIVLPRETDDDLAVNKEVDDVITQMELEAELFPSPPTKLTDLRKLNKDYRDAMPSPGNSSENLEQAKLVLKRAVLKAFKANSLYVLMVADGNRETAARSGYRLNKETPEKRNPTKPVVIKAVPADDPGSIRITLQDKAGCSFFLAELRNADGSYTLLDGFDRVRGALVRNLPAGKSLIRLVGRKGNDSSPYTDDFEVRAF